MLLFLALINCSQVINNLFKMFSLLTEFSESMVNITSRFIFVKPTLTHLFYHTLNTRKCDGTFSLHFAMAIQPFFFYF